MGENITKKENDYDYVKTIFLQVNLPPTANKMLDQNLYT